MKEELLAYIRKEQLARLRKNKDRACVNLLLNDYPSLIGIPKDVLTRFVQDYNSLDRLWRLIMTEHPELQGADYGDKVVLSQRKQLELGYRP